MRRSNEALQRRARRAAAAPHHAVGGDRRRRSVAPRFGRSRATGPHQPGVVHVVVLADTHLRGGLRSRLSDAAMTEIVAADAIVHAGDIMSVEALDELQQLAPVYAVLGNNDGLLIDRLPQRLLVDLEGLTIGLVHDSGAARGPRRAAGLVVSHC